MAKLRIGLIGFGVMGQNHFKTLQNIDSVDLVGVVDKNRVETNKVPYFSDYIQLLDKKPDGVIIATPTSTHKEIALQCFENNTPMLIEKPVAATAQEAQEIIKFAQLKGRQSLAHVGYIERFNPAVECLKKDLIAPDVVKIQVTRVGPYPKRINDVGILCDLSVHDIDLLRYLCEDEFASHAIFDAKTKHCYEDSAFINGKMSRGTIVAISTSWLSPERKRQIDVYTKNSFYKVDLLRKRVWKQQVSSADHSLSEPQELPVQQKQALDLQLREWLDFLVDQKPCRLATINDSYKTLQMIRINFSSQSLKDPYIGSNSKSNSSDSQSFIL